MAFRLPITSLLSSFALLAVLATTSLEAQESATVRQIASKSRSAVVTVRAFSGQQQIAFGTGFFIREDGVFVTNIHVVSGADTLSVELENGEIFDNVYGLAFDERRDLVVLKIPASNVPFLKVGDDRESEVGDTVYVVGNPLGYSGTFSDGLLSAKRLEDGVVQLQISAPISEGSSGGPVLNLEGEVIGVSTLTVTAGQNLNIAIPARHASDLLLLEQSPMKFESFAANLPQTDSILGENRVAETVAIFNELPAEMQAYLADMDVFQKQVATRSAAISVVLSEDGWDWMDDSKSGTLSNESVDGLSFTLTNGSYSSVAVCDDDCIDMDLYIYNSDDELITSDTTLDADSYVEFDVVRPGEYFAIAKMISCAVTDCLYRINLYKKN